MPKTLTVSICTFNRAERLPKLIAALRQQECPIPFNILVVDNNSSDHTRLELSKLELEEGAPLRFVTETQPGIPYARNRALEECLDVDYLLFMDDDELPIPGLVQAALDALDNEQAHCAGGKVSVDFRHLKRPSWLGDDLLGFLAEIDYGDKPFWITDRSTPIWTANVAYRMSIFTDDPKLRFDLRYNRIGKAVGGGSDTIMFRELLERRLTVRYRPDMVVEHHVEAWRLRRSYFLRLHFVNGRKFERYEPDDYARTLFGVPPSLVRQAVRNTGKAIGMYITRAPGALRQAMNAAYYYGAILGRVLRWWSSRAA